MRRAILIALLSTFALAGCGTLSTGSHVKSPNVAGPSLTPAESAQARQLLAALREGSFLPGGKTLLAAFGVGNATLGTIVSPERYLVLQVACVGPGSVRLAPVGTQVSSVPPSFPGVPQQRVTCTKSAPAVAAEPHAGTSAPKVLVPLTLAPGSGPTAQIGVLTKTSSNTQAVAEPVAAGSVWQDEEGTPLHMRVWAPSGTVWAVVIASAKSSH